MGNGYLLIRFEGILKAQIFSLKLAISLCSMNLYIVLSNLCVAACMEASASVLICSLLVFK